MYIERDLSLKVSKTPAGNTSYYFLNQHVTILTKDDVVLKGKILSLLSKGLALEDDEKGVISIKYEDIKDMADTDWLCGEDIRES